MKQSTKYMRKLARPSCVLQVSLYGAKQTGNLSVSRLYGEVLSWGLKVCALDRRLYFLTEQSSFIVILVVVDDIVSENQNPK